MDYDVWVPGNHEFNYGMDILSDVIGQHDCDVKSSIGGIREMIIDYIVNVKGVKGPDGISEFTAEDITEENADWKIVGFDWDAEKHTRAVDMVKEGKRCYSLFQCVLDKVAVFFDRPQLTEVVWCVLIHKIQPVGIGAVRA